MKQTLLIFMGKHDRILLRTCFTSLREVTARSRTDDFNFNFTVQNL